MLNLKKRVINLAREKGATQARVTTKDRLTGPPSADLTYVLPEARSVVVYAIALDRNFIPDYFGKVSRMGFKRVMYDTYQSLGKIGGDLVQCLQSYGYQAFCPSPNGVYRREVTRPGFLVPDFSHRYAALASGLATQGWSGNVLMPEYRAAAFYCSVVTNAELEPDEPLTEELCDKCKLCVTVCPSQFFSARETQTTALGGREYTSAKKRSHARCAISCAGLTGLSKDGKWSTWSTGRIELPEDDNAVTEVFRQAMADPANQRILGHIRPTQIEGDPKRGVLARSLKDTDPTCCNCCLVCSGPREWREKLVKLIHSSGVVNWTDNQEVVSGGDKEKSSALLKSVKESRVLPSS